MAILYQYGYTKYTIKSIAALITTQLHVVTALIYNKIIAMPAKALKRMNEGEMAAENSQPLRITVTGSESQEPDHA